MPKALQAARAESASNEETSAEDRRFSPRLLDKPRPANSIAAKSSATDAVSTGKRADQAASPVARSPSTGRARKRQRTASLPHAAEASAGSTEATASQLSVRGKSVSPRRRRRPVRALQGNSPGESSKRVAAGASADAAASGSASARRSGSSRAARKRADASPAPSGAATAGSAEFPFTTLAGRPRRDMRGRPPLVKPCEMAVLLWYKHGRYPYWPGLVKQSLKDKFKVVVTFPGWGRAEKEGVTVSKDWLKQHSKDFYGASHEDLVTAGYSSPYQKQFFYAMRKSKYMTDSLHLDTTLAQFLSKTDSVNGGCLATGDNQQQDHDTAESSTGDLPLLNEYDDTVAPDNFSLLELNREGAADTSRTDDFADTGAESNHAEQVPAADLPDDMVPSDDGDSAKAQAVPSNYREVVDITTFGHSLNSADMVCAAPVQEESMVVCGSESAGVLPDQYCGDAFVPGTNEIVDIACITEVACSNSDEPSTNVLMHPSELPVGTHVNEMLSFSPGTSVQSCNGVYSAEVISSVSAPEEVVVTLTAECGTSAGPERGILIPYNAETIMEPCNVACLVEVSDVVESGPVSTCKMTDFSEISSNEARDCQSPNVLGRAEMESSRRLGDDIEPGLLIQGHIDAAVPERLELQNDLDANQPELAPAQQPTVNVDQVPAVSTVRGMADCNEESYSRAVLAPRRVEVPTNTLAGSDARDSTFDMSVTGLDACDVPSDNILVQIRREPSTEPPGETELLGGGGDSDKVKEVQSHCQERVHVTSCVHAVEPADSALVVLVQKEIIPCGDTRSIDINDVVHVRDEFTLGANKIPDSACTEDVSCSSVTQLSSGSTLECIGSPKDEHVPCKTADFATQVTCSSSEVRVDATARLCLANGVEPQMNGALADGSDDNNVEIPPIVLASGDDGDRTKIEHTSADCLESAHRPTSVMINDGQMYNVALAGGSTCPGSQLCPLEIGLPFHTHIDGGEAAGGICPLDEGVSSA